MRLIDADAFKEYCKTGLDETKTMIRSGSMRAFAEELTEAFIRDIDEQPTVRSEYQVNVELTEEQLREFAKKMKNAPIVALSPDPGWIPCSERLPEKQTKVLVVDFGEVDTAYINSEGRWMDFHGDKLKDVTAWMPLPEVYKEVENG